MSEAIIIAAIGAGSTLVTGAILEIVRRFLGRAKDKEAKEEALSAGLRLDLARKEQENASLKKEADLIESEKDQWRELYWSLYEQYMTLRITARTLLVKNGLSDIEIDKLLPEKQPLMEVKDERTRES